MGDEKKPKVINLGKGQIRRATGQAWEGETKEWKESILRLYCIRV